MTRHGRTNSLAIYLYSFTLTLRTNVLATSIHQYVTWYIMATSGADRIQLPVLLLSATLVLLSAAAPSCQARPVLDSEGDPVRIDGVYTLKLVAIGFFGGVTVFPSANQTRCAAQVGLGEETDPGSPVVVIPGFQPADGILEVSARTRILIFRNSFPDTCEDPWSWTTGGVRPGLREFTPIFAGREPGSPPETRDREWFEVRETDRARVYNLIYCDTCLPCEVFCGAQVGLKDVDGKTLLGVGGQPFPVRFVKASLSTPAVAAT